MGKKISLYIILTCIVALFLPIQVQAVEKTPEYVFQMKREKTYEEAKEPSKYKEITWREFNEKYPNHLEEIVWGDSITINGITCTMQPWNEGDFLGQIEAFSKVYITQIKIDEEIYYTGRNITREDLYRYRNIEKTIYITFEDTMTMWIGGYFWTAGLGIESSKEIYVNFDKEKEKVERSHTNWDLIYKNPFREFGVEWGGESHLYNPKLEVNGQQIDYMTIVEQDKLPAHFVFYEVPEEYANEGIKGVHEDGTVCMALSYWVSPVYNSKREKQDGLFFVHKFYIDLSECENCSNSIKVAGLDIKAGEIESLEEKLSQFDNSSRILFVRHDTLNYTNNAYDTFYYYVQDSKNILKEFDNLNDNYIVVE